MSTASDIVLPGSAKSTMALRPCSKCHTPKRPEGGAELGRQRWVCATCWRAFNARK